ncbi:hypothetical protein LJ739_16915 [Aestuariibacter halophilus]|uniref:Uncharacterized protein n=1 Tax=Fluctibacter halophilus TaxID=226011 RepID=A0ABS8GBL7_9ALTE|nr:hypothetical protein [Aestuariibacter halophilus]MCC2617937.1 hypothetical protein [Aestuariibacter halophilus]
MISAQITYEFPSAQIANRFLNTLTSWSVSKVDARLAGAGDRVRVRYTYGEGRFDSTASALDDLASQLDGHEVNAG